MESPGRVRRLTAAIVVNDRMSQLATRGKAAVWQPRSADELRNLTALAQAAIGFETARGDIVTVQDLAFEENRTSQPPTFPGQVLATAQNSPELVKYSALIAGLLLVLAFGVRPALRRARPVPAPALASSVAEVELPAGEGGALPHVLKPVELPEMDPERIRAQEILDQVSGHLKREPTQSSRLLQSWIHSD
jgi:flagellar M-ring protein FliF